MQTTDLPSKPPVDALPDLLRTVSAALVARNPADSLGYTLSRIASWERLRRLPPNTGGRTTAMPPVDEASAVQALIKEGRKIEALAALNDLTWTAPFWFEGHRITAGLAAELGPDYAVAQTCVGGLVSLLLRRMPPLLDFTFNDGSPWSIPRPATGWRRSDMAPPNEKTHSIARTAEARKPRRLWTGARTRSNLSRR